MGFDFGNVAEVYLARFSIGRVETQKPAFSGPKPHPASGMRQLAGTSSFRRLVCLWVETPLRTVGLMPNGLTECNSRIRQCLPDGWIQGQTMACWLCA